MWHDIDMKWYTTLHMHMGVSALLRSTPQLVIDEWARYHWTKSNRVALLNEIVKKLCQIIARKARYSLG